MAERTGPSKCCFFGCWKGVLLGGMGISFFPHFHASVLDLILLHRWIHCCKAAVIINGLISHFLILAEEHVCLLHALLFIMISVLAPAVRVNTVMKNRIKNTDNVLALVTEQGPPPYLWQRQTLVLNIQARPCYTLYPAIHILYVRKMDLRENKIAIL